jgi:hypothetical protein
MGVGPAPIFPEAARRFSTKHWIAAMTSVKHGEIRCVASCPVSQIAHRRYRWPKRV